MMPQLFGQNVVALNRSVWRGHHVQIVEESHQPLSLPHSDAREIEVLASGLPMHHGAQLAVDITMRSALTVNGSACPNAAHTDGAVLLRARLDKERKYHELLDAERCRLVVVGLEVGGRWSTESVDFVTALAGSKSQEAPPLLKGSAFFAWRRRWIRMLSISCARSFASSLVLTRSHTPEGQDGWAPDVADLFQSS